jgi:hypothetical protein
VSKIEDHLAEADRHISESEERLACQRELAEKLVADGHANAAAWATTLAATMQQSLDVMREHRTLILAEIAATRAEGGLGLAVLCRTIRDPDADDRGLG